MEKSFNAGQYVARVGQRLIADFATAGSATTPGIVGAARETPARESLKSLLPGNVGVGSGCIIDSYGGTSRQVDIVVYESQLCPVYTINDEPGATFYPCEGVIAVGEVKSRLTSIEFGDISDKIASVKQLRRCETRRPNDLDGKPYLHFRHYGDVSSVLGDATEEYDQTSKADDQIFGFALAGSLELSPKALSLKYVDLVKRVSPHLTPNMIATMNDSRILVPARIPPSPPSIMRSAHRANAVYCVSRPGGSFQYLLSTIYDRCRRGRTVDLSAFGRYCIAEGKLDLPGDGLVSEFSAS